MSRKVALSEAERSAQDQVKRRSSAAAMHALASEPHHPSDGAVTRGAVTPALMMQLQRSIGNAEAARLLARHRQQSLDATGPAHSVAAVGPKGTALLQRKVGRTDGVSDMTAEETKTWLETGGLWPSLQPNALDMIEAMMLSEDEWIYPGMGAAHLVQDARKLVAAGVRPVTVRTIGANVPFDRGLIHGTLVRATNKADLHVSPGDGATLAADMLAVAEEVYEAMTLTSLLPRRADGQVYLRPQGAAIIKIVSQMLGEALGDPQQIELAHREIKWRKIAESAINLLPSWAYTKPKMSPDVLDKSVAPEHTEYIKSLVGLAGVDIKPLLRNTVTLEEFTQNMLEASADGQARLLKYLQTVQTAVEPVSMDIYIDRARLSDVIAFMRAGRRTQ